MRPRTGQLWRVAAGVAITLGAIAAAGISAAATPAAEIRSGTEIVRPAVPVDPSAPAPTVTPVDPTPSPTPTCTECECSAPVEPTPGPTLTPPLGRVDAVRLDRPAHPVNVQFNAFTNGVGTPGFRATPVIAIPEEELGGFVGRTLTREGGCYTLTFQNAFLKCEEISITINPGNVTARTKLAVTSEGGKWVHRYTFANDAHPGQPMLNKNPINIAFTCRRA